MADSPARGLTADQPSLEPLLAQYEDALGQFPENAQGLEGAVYRLLLLRDQIESASGDGAAPPLNLLQRTCDLDARFRNRLDRLPLDCAAAINALREAMHPPEENWWWYHQRSPSPWWTIGAVLFLTFSVTLITDFTRRVLSTDPDEIGILSVGVQALLAVAATSTFTDGGREWIEGLLLRLGVRPQYQPRWKLGATLALFALVLWAWEKLPGRLALFYDTRGGQASSSTALGLFERAVALNPAMAKAHYDLGKAYEQSYEYDKATAEYQQTIILDPDELDAYARLSRMLIVANQYYTALRVADDGAKKAGTQAQNADPEAVAGLRRDRAWAEFELGFLSDAEKDANLAAQTKDVAPSAYCVLGQIYTQEQKMPEAQRAWQNFQVAQRAPNVSEPVTEPDCSRLAAQGASAKN